MADRYEYNASVANQSKRQVENYIERYSRGLRNQNGEYIVNLCESNVPETIHFPNIEPELYFSIFYWKYKWHKN